MRTIILSFAVAVGVLGAENAAAQPPTLHSRTETHMGTKFTIQLYASTAAQAESALAAGFARIAALDTALSDYNPDSELSRLSAGAPHKVPVPISRDLGDILLHCQAVSQQSHGAFDATVGPITRLWRQARRQKKLPDGDKLRDALQAVGYQQMEVTKSVGAKGAVSYSAQLLRPHMRLDLGGIAQGYAADEVLAVLKAKGVTRALVNASGDLAASDPPPGQEGWRIGLTALDPSAKPSQFVLLANGAISTSGDAFQFVEVEGKRYSHIVDPQTGIGLTTRMSVTVWHPSATQADALASALCVLGPEKGLPLLADQDKSAALFVLATESAGTRIEKSQGYERVVRPAKVGAGN